MVKAFSQTRSEKAFMSPPCMASRVIESASSVGANSLSNRCVKDTSGGKGTSRDLCLLMCPSQSRSNGYNDIGLRFVWRRFRWLEMTEPLAVALLVDLTRESLALEVLLIFVPSPRPPLLEHLHPLVCCKVPAHC